MEKLYLITAIEPQVKTKDRLNIYLDGEYALSLHEEAVAIYRLKAGREIDESALAEIKTFSEQKLCFNKAMSYLSKKRTTEKTMITYLAGKGFSSDSIDKAIEKLKYYGYIDDVQYAKDYYRESSRGKGFRRIEYELKEKGVSVEEIVDSETKVINEKQSCRMLTEKFLKNKQRTLADKQKLYRYLQYRGYGFDVIKECATIFFSDDDTLND